ncbi:Hypothetical predicted protein [Cloeon dipterum]|uniref:Uncharacterized protein n=1 Tax=Cloeon dipterum TaxID=197152 RepID=A0A8S1BYE7_9INSE|nr:Hypothetical predicted protein [Cloeon dipterum]
MDEYSRLERAKTRLKNLRLSSKNLRQLAAAKIVKNVGYFIENEERKKKLAILPTYLQEKLLHELMSLKCLAEDGDWDRFSIHSRALPHLLGRDTRVVSLNGYMTFCPKLSKEHQLTQTLETIVTHAPNIRFLKINEIVKPERSNEIVQIDTKSFCVPDFKKHLDRRSCNLIARLHNLRKLRICSRIIKLSKVRELCRKLRKLEWLEVRIDGNNNLPCHFAFRHNLKNLRVFVFLDCLTTKDKTAEVRLNRLAHLCVDNLPKLEIVQNFADVSIYDLYNLGLGHVYSTKLSLRHLCTEPTSVDIYQLYPNITHLKVKFRNCNYTDDAINNLLKFEKLESLTLLGLTSEERMQKFLEKYGRNLRSLSLRSLKEYATIHFNKIVLFCPRLEKLSLDMIDAGDVSEGFRIHPTLQEFTWIFPRVLHMSSILMAPMLKKFSLICEDNFTARDLSKVRSMIGSGEILQNLESLLFKVFTKQSLDNNSTRTAFKEFSNFDGEDWEATEEDYAKRYPYSPYCSRHNAAAFDYVGDPNLVNFLNAFKHE